MGDTPAKKRERIKSMLEAYAIQSSRCAVCWWRKYRPGRNLELHHIVGRRGGIDCHHHRNLVMVCNECHYGFHSGGQKSLSLGQILQAKEDEDGEVDVSFLAKLMGRVGLREDPAPLPDWAQIERQQNAKR